MATQNAFGLRWTGFTRHGAPAYLNQYAKLASDAQAIFMNDLLMKVANSVANPEGGNPIPACKSAATGTPGTGLWLGTSLNYGAASTATQHLVVDDPMAVFLVQSDSSTAKTVANQVGKNANIVVSGAGSTTTKQSGMVLNGSSVATTSGLDVRIVGWWNNLAVNPDNAAYPILEVTIALHQHLNSSTAGV
jgi:hypothetical protein